MATIIDYAKVLERLTGQGLHCNYPNGGAFGYTLESRPRIRAWIGPDDATIRPALKSHTRKVALPYEATLANLVLRAWREVLPGVVWMMPGSHWSFELRHGAADWLPEVIRNIGLDPVAIAARTDGSAVEFVEGESESFATFLQSLLEKLHGSDFFMAFPGHPIIGTVHHHKQIWWVTPQKGLEDALDGICA